MRIPDNTPYVSFLRDLQQTQEQLLDIQRMVTSGKKVQKPSDDPAAAADIVRLSSEKAAADQFGKNIDAAKLRLTAADTALDGVELIVERAREVALGSLSNLSNNGSAQAEIDSIREQLLFAANTTQQGRYIFGGTKTMTAPFVRNEAGTVTY